MSGIDYIPLQVDCLVCTAGGIEEDFMKCLAPSYLGAFSLSGKELRKKGINRTGNLLVPNNNYTKLEEWVIPLWNQMLEEQKTQVRMIWREGEGGVYLFGACVVLFCCPENYLYLSVFLLKEAGI